MDNKTFEAIVQHQIELSTSVLIKKAGEYASGDDRLHNFRRAAGLRGKTKREVLGGMMLKHTVSVYDLIEMDKVPSEEYVEEKLTDHINYLLLLKAVLEEERMEERLAQPQPEEPTIDTPRVTGWYAKRGATSVFANTIEEANQLCAEGYTRETPAELLADDPYLAAVREKLLVDTVGIGWYKHSELDSVYARTQGHAERLLDRGFSYMNPQPDSNEDPNQSNN